MPTRKLEIRVTSQDQEPVTKNTLVNGDCLEVMPRITAGSIDLILTDPPYGTTACKWDSIIPLEPMWEQLKRLIKLSGAIVMTASQPFTTTLISSNMEMFKYCWVWEKNTITGFMQAKTRPLKSYEDIVVFGQFMLAAQYFNGVYNPRGVGFIGKKVYSNKREVDHITGNRNSGTAVCMTGYPKDVIKIESASTTVHPTQKPVALMEYLIKTYTNESDTVLEFTMGSGTTGVACQNLNRDFIGIELDVDYFNIACSRIHDDPELNAATLASQAQSLSPDDFNDIII